MHSEWVNQVEWVQEVQQSRNVEGWVKPKHGMEDIPQAEWI